MSWWESLGMVGGAVVITALVILLLAFIGYMVWGLVNRPGYSVEESHTRQMERLQLEKETVVMNDVWGAKMTNQTAGLLFWMMVISIWAFGSVLETFIKHRGRPIDDQSMYN